MGAEAVIFKRKESQNSFVTQSETNLTRIHKDAGSIPGLVQWVLDLELLQAVV